MTAAPLTPYLKLFKYYKQLGDKSIAQIKDNAALFWTPGTESNSIAVIVQHLSGNMLSRWTDFLNSDGEKEWRDRDQEFELYIETRTELIEYWEKGWTCLFRALDSVTQENKDELVYIRKKGHTIEEAVQRQLAHYAYHIGQIVYLARMITGSEWSSLSIAKGASAEYNKRAVAPGTRKEHFTDGLMDDKKTI